MSKFHFLNVRQGGCKIIEHNSGRVTMKDICNGNAARKSSLLRKLDEAIAKASGVPGNFGMCQHPTHPLDYLDDLGINSIHRFILSHPDMDHMDGLDALFEAKAVANYWDSGVRRKKPDFNGQGRYNEEDWERYESILAGTESGLTVLEKLDGARFEYANRPEGASDGLFILAPDKELVEGAGEHTNDASYVVLYRTSEKKILMPGDAHDNTWDFVLENYPDQVADCSILVAPHHGRDSDMDFSFLKTVNPKLVLMGCAASSDLAYDKYRNYETLTNNQAGNVVAETTSAGTMDVYVQNEAFAKAAGRDLNYRNSQGYVWYCQV